MPGVRKPQPLGLAPSFGFGDQLGLATPGHVDALRAHGGRFMPVFAQHACYGTQYCGRGPSDVMRDAVDALVGSSFRGRWTADADRLRTQEDVNAAVGAGFIYFTIDLAPHIEWRADEMSGAALQDQFKSIRAQVDWIGDYVGKTVELESGLRIIFDERTVKRLAVKFGHAIAHAVKIAAHVDRVMEKRGRDYEIEIDVSRVVTPTTLAEHYVIADQCLRSNVNLIAIALRFVRDWEIAVDFRGDRDELLRSVREQAVVARRLGPYKLSLTRASDKYSIYEPFARLTNGLCHIRTCGTSYLEALRTVVRHEPVLFRRIVDHARNEYDRDSTGNAVSARCDQVCCPSQESDNDALEQIYLNEDIGRQILHVTSGSVLVDSSLGPALRDMLVSESETHRQLLARHMGRHLSELCRGLESAPQDATVAF